MTGIPAKRSEWPLVSALWRRLNRDLGLRVIALLIAAGLWVFVNAGQRTAIESLHVPVEYRKLPAGLVILNQPPRFVKVQVAGPRTLLSLLDPGRLAARLDLSGIGPGRASFKINPAMFGVPRQTIVTSVSPSEVVLDVGQVIRRELPVHVDLQGPVGAGYEVADVQATPALVTATGLSRFVSPLERVNTGTFDVRGATGDVARRVALEKPGAAVSLSITAVDVKVRVAETITNREFRGLPVVVRDSDYKFRIEPSRASLIIRGPSLRLASLDPNGLVYVDAKELAPGSYDVPLKVNLPDGIRVVRRFPDRVKLRLYRGKRTAAHDDRAA